MSFGEGFFVSRITTLVLIIWNLIERIKIDLDVMQTNRDEFFQVPALGWFLSSAVSAFLESSAAAIC